MSNKINIMFLLLLVIGSVSFSKNSAAKLLKPVYYENIKFEALHDKDGNRAYIEATDTVAGKKVWEFRILKSKEKNIFLKSIKKIKRELIVKDNLKRIHKLTIPDSLFHLVQINRILKEYPEKSRDELEDYFRRIRNGSEIIFEAKIDTFFLDDSRNQDHLFGINYLQRRICNLEDTCHLIIGFDANFLARLSNLKYVKNEVKICKSEILYLNIHSPSQSGLEDQDKNSLHTFKLSYYYPTDSTLHFSSFQKIKSIHLE